MMRPARAPGDVMGPSLLHLGHLVGLPHGCGEQNMVNFAPNTYVLTYLHRTDQLTPAFRQQALEDLVKGQRISNSVPRNSEI